MQTYLNLLNHILINGQRQSNRTGIDSIFVPGAMMQFNVHPFFPAVTTKKLFFKKTVGELIGFLRGCDNAAQFRELGCDIWDKNANEHGTDLNGNFVENKWLSNPNRKGEDDLGRVYGVQWRNWRWEDRDGSNSIDQVQNVLTKLVEDPTDRRMIINAWRPDEFDQMALPPCHILSQFLADVNNRVLNLCYYQRSCDVALGVPFNIASYALMLFIFAKMTGFTPGTLTAFMADTHIYVNHLEGVAEQLTRKPYAPPRLAYSGPDLAELYKQHGVKAFDYLRTEYFSLEGYEHHPAIKFDMAV